MRVHSKHDAVCRSELFSYETCIFYTVLTSVPTLDRVSLKSKVVDAPEILTVIESIPHLSTFLNALYKCQYADFFKVRFLLMGAMALLTVSGFRKVPLAVHQAVCSPQPCCSVRMQLVMVGSPALWKCSWT